MSWNRQYRPSSLAQLHLQAVKTKVSEWFSQGKIPQVILLAGPKGTGKTSTARIIAAMINDEANGPLVDHIFFKKDLPKGASFSDFKTPDLTQALTQGIIQGSSFIVQELDAASNRGIDDVRALKERSFIPPQVGRVSVFILDEAHMLTTEAFNALLKLLEEPPAHALFMLATTERHKIPATITSRCQVLEFTQASTPELVAALAAIAEQEKITVEVQALEQIAQRAEGSFRDAIKLFEQVATVNSTLTVETVEQTIGSSFDQELHRLVQAVIAKDAAAVTQVFSQVRQQRVNPTFFLTRLCQFLHLTLLQGLGVEAGQPQTTPQIAHFLLGHIQGVKEEGGAIPLLSLELKLLEILFKAQGQQSKKASEGTSPVVPSVAPAKKKVELMEVPDLRALDVVLTTTTAPETVSSTNITFSDNIAPITPGDSQKLLEQWERFVELVTEKNSTVAALLRSAKPLASEGNKAQIAVFYKFHKEQLQLPKFMQMIEECVKSVTGGPIQFEFILSEPAALTTANTMPEATLSSLAEELLV